MPQVAGVSPHVTLVLDLETLRGETRCLDPSPTGPGAPRVTPSKLAAALGRSFGRAALERLACSADITPLLIDGFGQPLALGRSSRLASPHQMKAMWARDGGCVVPGCGSRFVQAHHIQEWFAHDGPTDVDEMVLLCERCHHLVHDDGWVVEHDPERWGRMRFRHRTRGVTVPAVHAVDREPGATIPLPRQGGVGEHGVLDGGEGAT